MTNNSSERQKDRSGRKMKKGKVSEDRTLVVKLGLEYFTTADSCYPVCNYFFQLIIGVYKKWK